MVHGSQAGLAGVVDEGDARKVDAKVWCVRLAERALPAILQLRSEGADNFPSS